MTGYQLLNYLIAAVWLVNGLFCKVLNLVPRHDVCSFLLYCVRGFPGGASLPDVIA
jgi:hypothetical protein